MNLLQEEVEELAERLIERRRLCPHEPTIKAYRQAPTSADDPGWGVSLFCDEGCFDGEACFAVTRVDPGECGSGYGLEMIS